ncbi:MAG TPA: hypothetical protein VIF09_15875 [Polyangiaceae bacterium]
MRSVAACVEGKGVRSACVSGTGASSSLGGSSVSPAGTPVGAGARRSETPA